MSDVERVSTGIPGLDDLIEGGFVKGSSNIVTGAAGTGKTMFSTQYIWEGLQKGENCMFITFEEMPEKIIAAATDFGWDLQKYVDSGQLIIKYKEPLQGTSPGEDLFWFRNELHKHDIDRIALDSTSILSLYFENEYDIRKNLFKLVRILEDSGATSVLTAEAPEGQSKITRYGIEEFVVDGVIVLHYIEMGSETFSNLQIRKMRRTDISKGMYETVLEDDGIHVQDETVNIK